MILTALSLARKVSKTFGSNKTAGNAKPTPRRPGFAMLLAICATLLTMIATILAVLCVCAGSKPGMMNEYAIFTLNTSRIGENLRNNVDSRGAYMQLKRSALVALPTITPAPTTLITMAPRSNVISDVISDASSVESHATSDARSLASAAHSAVTSVETAVASAANSVAASAKTDVINAINKVFNGVVDELNLTDFYSIYISTSCQGTYLFKNGTEMTAGNSSFPTKGTHEKVESCSAHSSLDPISLLKIVYWTGIVFTAGAFLLGIAGIIFTSKRVALWNIIGSAPAFCFMHLASAVTHGLSIGAAHLVNFVGEDVGIQGQAGRKFLTLSWTTTCLILINMALWSLVYVLRGRSSSQGAVAPASVSSGGWGLRSMRRRPDRTSTIVMDNISRPVPVDRHGVQMI
ncbi:hypothetical protein LTR85_010873 [Meristemomyces frigidus]|nr:hypothetical protein LTR85_010873 [Meristemomyces frigidus]